eukprot:gene23628-27726_t
MREQSDELRRRLRAAEERPSSGDPWRAVQEARETADGEHQQEAALLRDELDECRGRDAAERELAEERSALRRRRRSLREQRREL